MTQNFEHYRFTTGIATISFSIFSPSLSPASKPYSESLIRLFDSIRTGMRNNVPVLFDAKHREIFFFRTIAELELAVGSHD